MSLSIKRIKPSGYFSPNFQTREEQLLLELGHVERAEKTILISNTDVTAKELESALSEQQVELIIHPNSGYNNFDPEMIQALSVPVILGNEIRAQAVSEYVISHLFNIHHIHSQLSWDRMVANEKRLLSDLKVLVYGYGHVGKLLETKLTAIVKSIDFIDPFQEKSTKKEISEFDVIILACSLNEQNYHLINEAYLSQLNSRVAVINPARGGLVDLKAMLAFLKEHPFSFYATDVYEKEPQDLNQFLHYSNMSCTSHIAGCSESLEERILHFERKIIEDYKLLDHDTFEKRYQRDFLSLKIVNGAFI